MSRVGQIVVGRANLRRGVGPALLDLGTSPRPFDAISLGTMTHVPRNFMFRTQVRLGRRVCAAGMRTTFTELRPTASARALIAKRQLKIMWPLRARRGPPIPGPAAQPQVVPVWAWNGQTLTWSQWQALGHDVNEARNSPRTISDAHGEKGLAGPAG